MGLCLPFNLQLGKVRAEGRCLRFTEILSPNQPQLELQDQLQELLKDNHAPGQLPGKAWSLTPGGELPAQRGWKEPLQQRGLGGCQAASSRQDLEDEGARPEGGTDA